jgi:hypothetical protein
MAVTGIVDALLVVLAVFDTPSRQLAAVILTLVITHVVPPLLDRLKNKTACLAGAVLSHVSLGGVMKYTGNDAITETVYIGAVVVNGLHDLRNDPVKHLGSRTASNFIEDL